MRLWIEFVEADSLYALQDKIALLVGNDRFLGFATPVHGSSRVHLDSSVRIDGRPRSMHSEHYTCRILIEKMPP